MHSSNVFQDRQIKPLIKKPTLDTNNIQNYKPVSLLLFLYKTLEHVISNQLSYYLSHNNLTVNSQASRRHAPLRQLSSR